MGCGYVSLISQFSQLLLGPLNPAFITEHLQCTQQKPPPRFPRRALRNGVTVQVTNEEIPHLLFSSSLIQQEPHQPPCHFSNVPSRFPPQGLCTCFALHLTALCTSFYPVNSYLNFRVQLRCCCLQEAFPETPSEFQTTNFSVRQLSGVALCSFI